MKVLITGCARSGTSLLLYVSKYFDNTYVPTNDEYMPTKIYDKNCRFYLSYPKDKILVIKRPRYCLNSKCYESILDILLMDYKIIFLIRDGRDVLVSMHPPFKNKYHVTPERWVEVNEDAKKYLSNDNVLLVKYECFVTDTKTELDKMAHFLGIGYNKKYNEFYKYIDDKEWMKHGLGFKGLRPIQSDSIGNWKLSEHKDRMQEIINSSYIERICDLLIFFGYEKDNKWIKKYEQLFRIIRK